MNFKNVSTDALKIIYTGETFAAKNPDGTWNRKILIDCAKRNGYKPEEVIRIYKEQNQ